MRRSAVCAFAPEVRHLDRLPSAQPWTRPAAIVLFDGLPGQPPGTRAVLMRPTREALARQVVAQALAAGEARPLDRRLAPLDTAARTAAYLALFVPPPADPGATASCTAPGQGP